MNEVVRAFVDVLLRFLKLKEARAVVDEEEEEEDEEMEEVAAATEPPPSANLIAGRATRLDEP